MIEKDELLSLIPHRGKMVMLSRISDFDTKKRTLDAEFDIEPSCIFYDASMQGMPAWAGFECMAQAISALSGLSSRELSLPRRAGAILSVSNLDITRPVLSSRIKIRVWEDCRMDSIFMFNGLISCGGETALCAELTVIDVEHIEDLSDNSRFGKRSKD
ncbi:MAG: 3-hydroxylacyl-ACP dehydratase [Spirochaetaceae bacterium]|jgi:predicted hotdog family 3-hydroxylacyl-ACP dehydratase|nr:3-hydroxylacyl-ACP dehydratase [Spirochaetaceae bacterium]